MKPMAFLFVSQSLWALRKGGESVACLHNPKTFNNTSHSHVGMRPATPLSRQPLTDPDNDTSPLRELLWLCETIHFPPRYLFFLVSSHLLICKFLLCMFLFSFIRTLLGCFPPFLSSFLNTSLNISSSTWHPPCESLANAADRTRVPALS